MFRSAGASARIRGTARVAGVADVPKPRVGAGPAHSAGKGGRRTETSPRLPAASEHRPGVQLGRVLSPLPRGISGAVRSAKDRSFLPAYVDRHLREDLRNGVDLMENHRGENSICHVVPFISARPIGACNDRPGWPRMHASGLRVGSATFSVSNLTIGRILGIEPPTGAGRVFDNAAETLFPEKPFGRVPAPGDR